MAGLAWHLLRTPLNRALPSGERCCNRNTGKEVKGRSFEQTDSMPTSLFLKLYLATVPVFFMIDLVWLGLVARDFYRNELKAFLSPRVNWPAAIVFYLIYIAGILFFAVRPAIAANAWPKALYLGALYGFFTYATYDLTNMATLQDWPLKVVLVDILWGVLLCASVASISFQISRWLG